MDVVLLNLQYGDVDKEIGDFTKETGIEVLQCRSVDNREDLDGLAALIELCDLESALSSQARLANHFESYCCSTCSSIVADGW